MKQTHLALRMSLGGALCGGYLGIIAGALVGAAYGWFVDNLSLGLDGAMVGGAIAAAAGAVYGLIAGVDEGRRNRPGFEPIAVHAANSKADVPV